MTVIASRKSVLGIEPEVTEGVLVLPTGATSFIPLQSDFDLTPGFEDLENEDIKNSIAPSKTIRGVMKPSMSLSGYLRHSGVEGTAPNIAPVLKALLGTQKTQATERTLTSGSTTTVLKLAAGGTDYARGDLVLVKDSTNGYTIMPVHSVSTNDLTMAFSLPGSPASGVTLGKHCMFQPANEDHQTISGSYYGGNGGIARYLAGGRVTEGSFEWVAGKLIKAKFKIDGIWYGENSILITTSNRHIDFEDQDGVQVALLPLGWYQDPHDLADAAAQVMNDASARTVTCAYDDSDGKFDWTCTGTTFKLLWNTGANTATTAAAKFGDSSAADRTGSTSYSSTNAMTFAAAYTPSYDAADPLVAKQNSMYFGDQTNYQALKPSRVTLTITDDVQDIEDTTSASGIRGTIVMGRKVKMTASGLLEKYDVQKFKRYRAGTETRVFYAYGSKVGGAAGNWEAGKCGGFYLPTTTVSEFNHKSEGGKESWELTCMSFADSSGNGEVYKGFV